MKTTIYWTMQHSRLAMREFRFRASCWWLSQQVEFLEWQLHLKALRLPAQSNPASMSVGQGDPYAAH